MLIDVKKPNRSPSMVQMFARYKAWATEITFEALSKLPEEELVKPRQTNFGNILHTLNHVYVVDDIFRAHLEGQKHHYQARNTEFSMAFDDLWQKSRSMDAWYIEQADRFTEPDLTEVIEFEFVGGGQGQMSRTEILLHIVNHGTYHRGFVSDMVYQIPSRLPANDLPVFLRDVWHKT
ncbi:DinB family protein [Kiloniella majae]|uniref:DinB family protein n=1 Tax=Kiloniella majae TaxID=1938558 RepID=UPI001FEFE140|nr:DinB family protein [Kiloniella majae]